MTKCIPNIKHMTTHCVLIRIHFGVSIIHDEALRAYCLFYLIFIRNVLYKGDLLFQNWHQFTLTTYVSSMVSDYIICISLILHMNRSNQEKWLSAGGRCSLSFSQRSCFLDNSSTWRCWAHDCGHVAEKHFGPSKKEPWEICSKCYCRKSFFWNPQGKGNRGT